MLVMMANSAQIYYLLVINLVSLQDNNSLDPLNNSPDNVGVMPIGCQYILQSIVIEIPSIHPRPAQSFASYF